MDQVEWSGAFRFAGVPHALQSISIIPLRNIDSGKRHVRDHIDNLGNTTLFRSERSPQDIVSPHDFHQGTLQDFYV